MTTTPDSAAAGLARFGFGPRVSTWFAGRYGEPTDVQAAAWERIGAGEHLLITAPTGSGKTLAAFLWALDRLASGRWPLQVTSVLYVSPLRALNNDIQRNLLAPLDELRQAGAAHGDGFPEIRVLTRSGDTPASERERMLRRPPEILITTPESLNLLLATARGQEALRALRTVILDEIHAVAGTKRGVHLMTAVERLVPLAGEFQRLALSATVRPLAAVAELVGGRRVVGPDVYEARPVHVLQSGLSKRLELRLIYPEPPADHGSVHDHLAPALRGIIDRNRATLVFVNSRRFSEAMAAALNADQSEPRAYAHHGSLAREVRLAVEERLKAGRLRSIVATSSLELGIDIGALDETVLVQAPPSVAAALQRIGRAGHQVGEVSRGTLVATHPHDLLELAAVAQAVAERDIESTRPIDGPLDVLAQVLINATAVHERTADELFGLVRTSHPFRDLQRRHFDLVVAMLCGRYAGTRVRELKPRLSLDPATGGLRATAGALQALRASGGTIPDRGYFQMRHLETRARLGELDEEFVWENGPGSRFTFGNRPWRVERVTHNDVLVLPAGGRADIPFWRAEEPRRSFHLAQRVGGLLRELEQRRGDPGLAAHLAEYCFMDPAAVEQLLAYLDRQRAATGRPLPHRWHLLVEFIESGPQGAPGNQIFIHALWGRDVTRPYALALQAAWTERFGHAPEIHANNDGVALVLPGEVGAQELLALVPSGRCEALLRQALETSSFFGARFRECAGRALLLSRGAIGRRQPLWLSRLKSQELLDAVAAQADFPVLLEAWRTCCQDEFDLPALRQVLEEIEDGRIEVTWVRSAQASPFAQRDVWRQVNEYMYAEEPSARRVSSLSDELVRDLVFTPQLRPAVDPAIAAELESKLQRLAPGYAPQTNRELVDWIGERLLVPWPEWLQLVARLPAGELEARSLAERLARVQPRAADEPLVCSRLQLGRVLTCLYADHAVQVSALDGSDLAAPVPAAEEEESREALVGWWLSFYGPVSEAGLQAALGLEPGMLRQALDDLAAEEQVVAGPLLRGRPEELWCDARNLESLIRMARVRAVVPSESQPVERLAYLVARCQGLVDRRDGVAGLVASLETLAGLPLPAGSWESDVLPARLHAYDPHWLDRALLEARLSWVGRSGQRLAFLLDGDLPLVAGDADAAAPSRLVPAGGARYPFKALQTATGLAAPVLAEALWAEAWAGTVANDGFVALRSALTSGFRYPDLEEGSRRGRRRLRQEPPGFFAGNWFRVEAPPEPGDEVDREELNKERVRLLLERYGVLCREILDREEPALRWSSLFRSLRLMEFSGEVVAGSFIAGLTGLQFSTPANLALLAGECPRQVFWMSSADPACLCGLDLPWSVPLPRRHPTTTLVYRGWELALVSRRHGRVLEIRLPPGDPDLAACYGLFHHLLGRSVEPVRRIAIETINGEPAPESPYVEGLRERFDLWVEAPGVILHRKRAL